MPAYLTEGDSYLACIEGLAGSGKSTVIRDLSSEIFSKGMLCDSFKLGGLGYSRRSNALREIRAFRQSIYGFQKETQKQTEDRLRGRIYCLALTAQARELQERMTNSKAQVYLLDRSPFMNSAHLRAEAQVAGEERYVKYSLYAEEVFKTELALTIAIGIKHIILLDISPELSIARMIVRYCGNDESDIVRATTNIKAPPHRQYRIYQHVCRLKASLHQGRKEPMDNWHLATPIDVVDAERDILIKTIERVADVTGIRADIVDANKDKDTVLKIVKKSVEKGLRS